MLDSKDFSFLEDTTHFDFKGLLYKLVGHWHWFLISFIITLTIAYEINIRKQKVYEIESVISVKEENNPFFTSNTSLVFNWGGTSDKVQTIKTVLKSRHHNEAVVSKLKYYLKYYIKGKYNYIDAYGQVPFVVNVDENAPQLLNHDIEIKFINQSEFTLNIKNESKKLDLYNYSTLNASEILVPEKDIYRKYKIGQRVKLPYLDIKIDLNDKTIDYIGSEYVIRFDDFNNTVSAFKNIDVITQQDQGAIMTLRMEGTNKNLLVDYLNTTVDILCKNELDSKNLFAKNTIAFIDSTLIAMEKELKLTEGQLKDFRKGKNIFEIESEGTEITDKLSNYDLEKDVISRKLAYYNRLESYLKNTRDYSKLPAPAIAGIDDPNIINGVSKLITLSTERSSMKYTVKNDKVFLDFDNEMESLRRVLLVNISSAKLSISGDLELINSKIGKIESNLKRLPDEQQELIKIKRKYDLSDNIYNTFLQKRSEADIVRAANVSDIQFLDPAKDFGGGLIGPKTSVNYVLALVAGFLIPLVIIFILTLLDNGIVNSDDIKKLTTVPVIGVTGKNIGKTNLAVFEKPKSAIAESFRAIRSSLQFLYRNQNIKGAKTVMITSSISGEGKSFCSANIATVFALSEKKTVIVVLDLRRPKISQDFNLTNDIGVVNYIIGQNTIEEITQKTQVPYLDVITSGPVPPNPSELILSDKMKELLDILKTKYDYIILDTPPIGLVSDALELVPYTDVTLYIIRQRITKKGMLGLLNEKNKRKELNNVSIVLNGFENKSKYGYNYGYKYEYMNYSYKYYSEDKKDSYLKKIKKFFIKLNTVLFENK